MCAEGNIGRFFNLVVLLKILSDAATILILGLCFKAANHFAAYIFWQGIFFQINETTGLDFVDGLQGFSLCGIVRHAVASMWDEEFWRRAWPVT